MDSVGISYFFFMIHSAIQKSQEKWETCVVLFHCIVGVFGLVEAQK